MKKKVIFIALLVLLILNIKVNKLWQDDKRFYDFIGKWKIVDIINYSDEQYSYDNYEIIIGDNRLSILDEEWKGIKYKLKTVDKNYILSYEHNLTIGDYIEEDKIDVISVIYDNKILGELFLKSKNQLIFIYKSMIISANRISGFIEFNNKSLNKPEELGKMYEKEGVMLALKRPRLLDENGEYTEEGYRTIWIAHDSSKLRDIYEKEDIIFPRINGIWKLSLLSETVSGKYHNYFSLNICDSKLNDEVEDEETKLIEVKSNEYKSIKFIGNDYIAVEKYIGEKFKNQYPIIQIIPVDNINSEKSISIEEIFGTESKTKYLESFKEAYNKLSPIETEAADVSNVDYTSLTMGRQLGKWILQGGISNKEGNNPYLFTLPISPNNKLINYNSLYIPWKSLIDELTFLKDAYTSPGGKIAIVQFSDYISIYRIVNGVIQGSPLSTILIEDNEEIVMAEWCSGNYVDSWEKFFLDGYNISN